MNLNLDVNDLTIDDVVDLEAVTGESIQSIMSTDGGMSIPRQLDPATAPRANPG